MRLEQITLENFRSYGHAEIDLSGINIASVVGPNGAGKSSIIDGVKFCLFGKSGITGNLDSYIRRGEEEARVTVIFRLASGRYRVTRTRSSRGSGKSNVELARWNGEDWAGDDTGATSCEDRIQHLLGVDAKLLKLTSIVEQGDSGNFFALQPGDRLQNLAEILRINEQYGPLEERFKNEAKTAEAELKEARADAERLEADVEKLQGFRADVINGQDWRGMVAAALAELEAQLEGAQARAQVSADAVKDADAAERRLSALLAADSELGDRIARLQTEADSIGRRLEAKPRIITALETKPALEDELAQLDEAERADATIYADRARFTSQRDSERIRLKDLEHRAQVTCKNLDDSSDAVAALEGRIIAIQTAAAPICDQCGQPIADAALESTLMQIRDRLEKAIAANKDLDAEHLRLINQAADAKDNVTHLEVSIGLLPEPTGNPTRALEIRNMLSRLEAAAQELAAMAPLEERRAALALEIRDLENRRDDPTAARERSEAQEAVENAKTSKATLAADRAAVDELTLSVAAKRKELSDADIALGRSTQAVEMLAHAPADLEAKRVTIAGLEQTYADTALLRKHMSKWGVPAYIVGNVLRQLEVQVNELLALYDGGFSIRFESEKETRDGARDSLEIMVFDGSAWDAFETYSGGEKFRIASAMRLGLALLLAHRSGARVETLLVDEPEGLDAEGRQHLVQILERMSAHFGLVLLLTHYDDLKDAMPSQIAVSRGEDGLSRVEVAA